MNGTRLAQAVSAQLAFTNGLKLSAFRVADGRRIRGGTARRTSVVPPALFVRPSAVPATHGKDCKPVMGVTVPVMEFELLW